MNTKAPNCVLAKIGGQAINVLLDSGADVSVIRKDIYDKVKGALGLELMKSRETLRNASGQHLTVLGQVTIPFMIGSDQSSSFTCHSYVYIYRVRVVAFTAPM